MSCGLAAMHRDGSVSRGPEENVELRKGQMAVNQMAPKFGPLGGAGGEGGCDR